MLGRVLSGFATSLLFSTFDAWMINEHRRLGFDQSLLDDTYGYCQRALSRLSLHTTHAHTHTHTHTHTHSLQPIPHWQQLSFAPPSRTSTHHPLINTINVNLTRSRTYLNRPYPAPAAFLARSLAHPAPHTLRTRSAHAPHTLRTRSTHAPLVQVFPGDPRQWYRGRGCWPGRQLYRRPLWLHGTFPRGHPVRSLHPLRTPTNPACCFHIP